MTDTDVSPSEFSLLHAPARSRTPRLIELSYEELEGSFSIPEGLSYHATQSRDLFLASLKSDPATTPASFLELFSRYLLFVIEHDIAWADARRSAHAEFVELLLDQFEHECLHDEDVHIAAAKLPGDPSQRRQIVRAYYAANAFLGREGGKSRSALFQSSKQKHGAWIYAVFGGQGNTDDYFTELRALYETYTAFVEPLIENVTELLRSLLLKVNVTTLRRFSEGLELLQWLRQPDTTPMSDYLLSAPVSFPIIGLIQLANYAVMCRILGISPGEAVKNFKGMTGHSQGIVVATAIATVDDWDSFNDAVRKAVTILFFIGSRGQEFTPKSTVPSTIFEEAVEKGEGFPTPMLNVSNCSKAQLQKQIDAINEHLGPEQQLAIGLINGRSNHVVSGPVPSLCALNANIRRVKAATGLDQSRINFSARKPEISNRYLPISVAFHSPHLEEAVPFIMHDLRTISISGKELKTSVFHTVTGKDLKGTSENLVPDLIRMIIINIADWPKSTEFPQATHILDFGPGGPTGVGVLTHRNKEGTGVRLILMSAAEGTSSEYGYRSELFNSKDNAIRHGADWLKDHGPKLFRSRQGDLKIDNAMTRLLGLPPVMVPGMTPSTVPWDFVSAITNAGFHVELAGGGYFNAEQMSAAISKLHDSIPVGRGICLNLIYASPKAIRWQVPLIQRLRSEGVPIDGLTFGAGVPSLNVANEYIQTLGMRYISFKPGSNSAIEQVISIARANADFPILVQWTGGRGGGHHSFEDFHDPMLKLYGKLRRCKNIVLIAGSGFGGADDSYPYLSGVWSQEYGYPPMPFDGCLFGSRMMVAKEAHTSKEAKEAIVAAPGLDNPRDWEKTYKGAAGGVITVRSEMGEPIHKLATRGVLLWREMDDKIFSISDKAARLAELLRQKPYIIKRLNKDFQKVWFGQNESGDAVDLQDMTYAEILCRLVQLLYVKAESRWIDPSYVRLVDDFVRRMKGRLGATSNMPLPKESTSFEKQPLKKISETLQQYPHAEKQVITFNDARYFVLLCQRPGQKPPTFVPDLDNNFEMWFKKDSLWQSEDLAAVVGQDAGRTCILQGPVAAKYSTVVDEPVRDILESINSKYIKNLLRDFYHDSLSKVPNTLPPQKRADDRRNCISHCRILNSGDDITYFIPKSVNEDHIPDAEAWFQLLAGSPGTWRHALLLSRYIFQGKKLEENPVRRMLAPIQGLHIDIQHVDNPPRTKMTVTERSSESSTEFKKLVDIRGGPEIDVTLYADETAEGVPLPLTLKFTHHPQFILGPIHEIMTDRYDRIRKFYYRIWFGSGATRTPISPIVPPAPGFLRRRNTNTRKLLGTLNTNTVRMQTQELTTPLELHGDAFSISSPSIAEFHGKGMTLSSPLILDFADSFGESRKYISARSDKTMAPLDFAIVVGWEAMMKAIFPKVINGDFLKLVHLSNKFQVIDGADPLSSDDRIECTANILSIMNSAAGRVVEVGAIIRREEAPVLELVSEFLFRGTYDNYDACFQKKIEPHMQLVLDTPSQVAVLLSKPWFTIVDDEEVDLLGHRLVFQLESLTRYETATTWRSVETWGQVFIQSPSSVRPKLFATVEYEAEQSTRNPVLDFLRRQASLVVETHPLENIQPLGNRDTRAMRGVAPASNQAYARASGDYNPIHVSRMFAKYSNLPGTITHGMYTSAAVRQVVEKAAGLSHTVRMKSYKVTFIGMVLPGDVLEVHVDHIAMKDGLRVLNFTAINVESGEKVVMGTAEVDQATTTYVFTGQGSQSPGMGMDLYATSEIAREVWDRADRYYSETYGFLISRIVKENPKELVIHFGGRRGYQLRQNYMRMTVESNGVQQRFFKNIDECTTKYTFSHKKGLLFSTEFAQPALTIMEHAQYVHLKSKGLFSQEAFFAGHSLGEYTALSTIGDIMPFEKLLSVVFYRGLTMQAAVDRDASGRSKFAMVAVNPGRVSKTFNQAQLRSMVELIRTKMDALLEIVNYNVEGQQYVCAGELTALDCLASVTSYIAKNPAPFASAGSPSFETALDALVSKCAGETIQKVQPVQLTRGVATIPLEGIDVPFHSSFLLPKMPAFRKVLLQHIQAENINPEALVGKYVSNVTGKPFEISTEYLQEVLAKTGSEPVAAALRRMEVTGKA